MPSPPPDDDRPAVAGEEDEVPAADGPPPPSGWARPTTDQTWPEADPWVPPPPPPPEPPSPSADAPATDPGASGPPPPPGPPGDLTDPGRFPPDAVGWAQPPPPPTDAAGWAQPPGGDQGWAPPPPPSPPSPLTSALAPASGWAPGPPEDTGWIPPPPPGPGGDPGWAPPPAPDLTAPEGGWAPDAPGEDAPGEAGWAPAAPPEAEGWEAATDDEVPTGDGGWAQAAPAGGGAPPRPSTEDARWAPPEWDAPAGPGADSAADPDTAAIVETAEVHDTGALPDTAAVPDADDIGWASPAGASPPAPTPLPPPAEPWTPGFRPEFGVEPVAQPIYGPGGAWADPAPADDAPTTDELADQARGAEPGAAFWPPSPPPAPDGHRAPSSPAYSTPVAAAYAAPEPEPDAEPEPLPPDGADTPPRRRSGALVAAGAVAALALVGGAAVLVANRGGGGDSSYTFGTVASAGDGAVITPGDGQASRTLTRDTTIHAGSVVRTGDNTAVTVDLAGGGVIRLDDGAAVTFLDLSADPDTGKPRGTSRPALQVEGGRLWVNPGGKDAPSAIVVRVDGGQIASRRNPVAVDCTVACTVEAPAGGASLTTTSGARATPGRGESVDIHDPEHLDLVTTDGPSAWAQRNLSADREADLPRPVRAAATSIKAGALLDGVYRVSVNVTGPATGDAIPADLRYRPGVRRATTLVVDGSKCVTLPCDLTVSGDNNGTGTARIADGKVTVTLNQPIDCTAADHKTVVVPNIGTTTLKATLDVLDADSDGRQWIASAFSGDGTLAATLAKPCAAGETLGTATSPVAVSATPAR